MSGYFEGWYYKHQTDDLTLSLIPGRADEGAFVQIITPDASYRADYPINQYSKGKTVEVGPNKFSAEAVDLNIKTRDIELTGKLIYKNIAPIKHDIMGPFRFFPMECRHSILSMAHDIEGSLTLNGRIISFDGGRGYIESDSGRSFPESYAWLHCNRFDGNNSIMVSIARIPFLGFRFWGCICVVMLEGQEYLLATYKGVKILSCAPDGIILSQGEYILKISVENRDGHALLAPARGKMQRIIRECACLRAGFVFYKKGVRLFEQASEGASFEYAME